jgi:hypothetical protein
MVSRQLSWLRVLSASAIVSLLALSSAPAVFAQEESRSSAVADVFKGVVFDPTTYAPSLIQYHATMRDWNTSQPFFHNGFVERNARFTVSGRPNDLPIGYDAGRSLILKDALTTLGVSAAQNLTSRIVERALLARYPDHPKVVKTIGWIQRIAVGSLMSYRLSAAHYRQAALNEQRARELGYVR